jgi:hypothetical protein
MPAKSLRSFRSYAAMEALNIVLAPPGNWAEILAMGFAMAACAGFLLVGAAYWVGLDQRLVTSRHGYL